MPVARRILARVFLAVCALVPVPSFIHAAEPSAEGADAALYAAVWEKREAPQWKIRFGLTGEQFQTALDEYFKEKYRPTRISGYTVGDQTFYACIWEKRSGPDWELRFGLSPEEYQNLFNEMAPKGFQPISLCGYSIKNEQHYSVIWEEHPAARWRARHGLTGEQYQKALDEATEEGYRPTLASAYPVGDGVLHAGVWQKIAGPEWELRYGLTSDEYQKLFKEFADKDYRPVDLCGCRFEGKDYYAAIWEQRSDTEWKARHGLSAKEFQEAIDAYSAEGYQPVIITGY